MINNLLSNNANNRYHIVTTIFSAKWRHLIALHNELYHIILGHRPNPPRIFIDLYADDIWEHNGGKTSHTAWAPNEPAGGNQDDCIMTDQGWHDVISGYVIPFLCEVED